MTKTRAAGRCSLFGYRAACVALWIVGVMGVLWLAIALALHPLAVHYTRKALDGMKGYRADFADADFDLLPPAYLVTRLQLAESERPETEEPLFRAERIRVSILWRQLLHGTVVARARIDEPKLAVINRPAKEDAAKEQVKHDVPDLAALLRAAAPLSVDRVEIEGGEILFVGIEKGPDPRLWIHGIDLAAENLVTREALAQGRPVTVAASARVQHTGDLSVFVSANPFAKGLDFAGRAELKDLQTAELYSFIAGKTDLQAPHGKLDCFVEFTVVDGKIHGGVKPVLAGVEVRPDDGRLMTAVKASLADTAVELLSDRVPDRNAVATVIPLHGDIRSPQAQLVPAVMGVLRNAFVIGLAEGFAHLPPPSAEKKQGVIEQVKATLIDEKPPKAQPKGHR